MPSSGTGGDLFGAVPGPVNGLADVPGIGLGHAPARNAEGRELSSGVTVVVSPAGAVGAVDVRGGGPGTRETDLLRPSNSVQEVHAIALCGGSAFGLDAAGGVMAGLESHGVGLRVFGDAAPDLIVPIVPAAVIFDLAVGDAADRPDAACGREAVEHALEHALEQAREHALDAAGDLPGLTGQATNGCLGAGRAATAGAVKGGFGQASAVLPTSVAAGYTVAVGLVVNPVGSVVDPDTGWPWGLGAQLGDEFDRYWDDDLPDPSAGGLAALLARGLGGTKLPAPGAGGPDGGLNTTIGVIATDAPVTKAQAERLAIAAHDGLSRAVRPAHLPMDGDTFFALSTADSSGADDPADAERGRGVDQTTLAVLASTAADCVERAVVHAVLAASTMFGVPSWKDLMS
ncbi:P1 family peptidase [Corynebacterium terpenotabidum]|uniref:L-aminopeptidase/D-esterase n=1 Tax=Corynebacterium terpenotabidum Y-11 TaxID=1200352 RepID=S4XFA4_9CORY|nr:P1 family peptidase [Corynebacterium terpenotabidum]AGP30300.1 hypothetical protein A606_03235 [Corynebacterium terpenotabidum Y-11]